LRATLVFVLRLTALERRYPDSQPSAEKVFAWQKPRPAATIPARRSC
jgi:hypothetical protein